MEAMKLCPHHGMCLGYYQGYGYSEPFNLQMQQILERMLENPDVQLSIGPDPICSECPHLLGNRCAQEKQVTAYDRAVLTACGLRAGRVLPFRTFAALVQSRVIDTGLRSHICGDCQWSPICSGKSRWEE